MIAAFSNESCGFAEHTYLYAYILLDATLDAYHRRSPHVVENEYIVAAIMMRPKETADIFMRTWHWAFGVSVGPGTKVVRRCAYWQLRCVRVLASLPDVRRHLIENGFITSICLAARKIVRGEIEGPSNVFSILGNIVDFLTKQTGRPAHMREALDAHIIPTILRIPGISLSLATDPHISTILVDDCIIFLSKVALYSLFPTLRTTLRRSFARVEELVARGAITWDGNDRTRLQREYLRCLAAASPPNVDDGRNRVPCSNTKVVLLI